MTHSAPHSLVTSFRRTWQSVALLWICCLCGQGCNWNVPKGEGFNDEMSSWGKSVRKQEQSDGTPLGTSNKALEIERNLGYR